jgi:O-antigen ligase
VDGSARASLRPEVTAGGTVVAAAAGTAGALGAVAVYSPKYAVVTLLAAAFVAVAVARLPLAVAAFVLLTFPEHLPGSLGAGATLAKPVGALLIIAWAGAAITGRGALPLLPRSQPALFWLIIGFLLFGAVSSLWAAAPGQTHASLGRLLLVAALALVAYTAASTRAGFRTIVHGYLLASVVTSVYSVASGTYVAKGRLAGLFDPNYFAAELIPAILVACFLFATAGSARKRWLAAAVAGIDFVAFALTQSRGGIVGLTVALLAALVFAGRSRSRMLALVLVLVAIGLGYYLGYKPAHVFASGGRAGTSSGRLDEWRVATRVFAGHPVGGVGLGNYEVVEGSIATQTFNLSVVFWIVNQAHVVHNTYLQMAAELGFVGLSLFLAILVLPLRLAARALVRLKGRLGELEFYARGLLAGAIGMLTAYVFLSAEFEKQLWLVLALLASVPAILRDEKADRHGDAVAESTVTRV